MDKTIFSQKHKDAIGAARKGKTHDEASKQKMRDAWEIRKARMAKTKNPITPPNTEGEQK